MNSTSGEMLRQSTKKKSAKLSAALPLATVTSDANSANQVHTNSNSTAMRVLLTSSTVASRALIHIETKGQSNSKLKPKPFAKNVVCQSYQLQRTRVVTQAGQNAHKSLPRYGAECDHAAGWNSSSGCWLSPPLKPSQATQPQITQASLAH